MGLPCSKCLPLTQEIDKLPYGEFKKKLEVEAEVEKWIRHFKRIYSFSPWALQKAWAKRIFYGRSFGLLAPTGIGKTTFGISMATYLSKNGKKSYIILPTKLLVQQVYERILATGVDKDAIVAFLEGSDKNILKERVSKGEFSIVISTSMFFYKNYQLFKNRFDFIFVDDVDSFLKTARNVDKVLLIMGFSESEIARAMFLIKNLDKLPEDKIEKIRARLKESSKKCKSILVISSATSQPKSKRIKLFRELLGFDVGKPSFYLRNLVDTYDENFSFTALVQKIQQFGKGGLVFVPSDMGKEAVEKIVNELNKAGIKAMSYEEKNSIENFESGKIDVLVGISSYKNPLARGIDLPHVIRYVIFYGVPKIKISLELERNPSHILWGLASLRAFIAKNEKLQNYLSKVEELSEEVKRYLSFSEEEIERKPKILNRIREIGRELNEILNLQEISDAIKNSDELSLKREGEKLYLVVADVIGYLQASGRASRMYAGGITKGLSLVLIDDKKAFKNLEKKIRWLNSEIEFLDIKEVNVEKVLKEIEEDRKKVESAIKETLPSQLMKPVLVIVESPNKVRTIANFFGTPIKRRVGDHDVFELPIGKYYLIITSSIGHVLDLSTQGFHGVLTNGELVPVYEILEGKESVIKSLRLVSEEVEEIFIATDPDVEGEKIGWDILLLLSPFSKKIKRAEFHEVTKRAFLKAIENPREIDENLVKAQLVRRISDRWVGFEISQLLQRSFKNSKLSAGRVQTPVLGWIIERFNEHKEKIHLVLVKVGEVLIEIPFEKESTAEKFFHSLKYLTIEPIEEKIIEKAPPPPYTTNAILKDSWNLLKFSPQKTMQLLQELFERGLITYHRTDSTRVSSLGLKLAEEYVTSEFGKSFYHPRRWSGEGAHECIRPTRNLDTEEIKSMFISGRIKDITRDHIKLYDIIFRRFIASQMKESKVLVKKVLISALDFKKEVEGIEKIIEDGFNLIFPFKTVSYPVGKIYVEDKRMVSKPKVPLFTYGSLIEEMKNKGIGRPSTYAITISKLLERRYVKEVNGYLLPTRLGMLVHNYLQSQENISKFVSEEFTRVLEERMDRVEKGEEDYQQILKNLYREIKKI